MAYKNELLERITQGEGLHLDFKHCISDAQKIARSLAAYANTDGGSLLIGVRDNGSIIGIQSEEERYMIETASLIHTYPNVVYRTVNHLVEGKAVLEVIVDKSSIRPHFAPDVRGDMKAFVRCADKNVVAPRELVLAWHYQKKQNLKSEILVDDDIKFIINEIKINGSITKEFIIYITQLSQVQVEELLAKLLVMGVIDVKIDERSVEYVFLD